MLDGTNGPANEYLQSGSSSLTRLDDGSALRSPHALTIGGGTLRATGGTVAVAGELVWNASRFELATPTTTLNVTGDYVQNGALKIAITGDNTTGVVAVSQHATLGGTVEVAVVDTIGAAGKFTFLTAAPRDNQYPANALNNVGGNATLNNYEITHPGNTAALTPKPAKVQGRVFNDGWVITWTSMGPGSYDGNGLQLADHSDPAYAGVTVALLDAAGAVVATTTTDANGYYQFAGLAPGQYRVAFGLPSSIPEFNWYMFTTQDAGDDALDSDADQYGLTALTTVAGGATATLDAGVVWYSRPAW